MLKLSVKLGDFENTERFREDLKSIKRAGFDGIDLQLNSTEFRRSLYAPNAMETAEKVGDMIREEGLEICQCHPPFNPYVYGKPQVGEAVIRDCIAAIPYAARAGAKLLVIHPKRPRNAEDLLYHRPEVFREWNMRMYSEMVPIADECGVTLLVENLFSVDYTDKHLPGYSSEPEELLELTDRFPQMGICMDTGHAIVLQKDLAQMVKTFGNKLLALHIHNNDGLHDLHLSPFSCCETVDWAGFGHALKEIGYRGAINLECDTADQTPASIRPSAYQYLAQCARYIASLAE